MPTEPVAKPYALNGEREVVAGCAFVLDAVPGGPAGAVFCGAPRRSGSAYCPAHHAACRLPAGSDAETWRLRELEALASAVGGRQPRFGGQPPGRLLARLARIERAFSRPKSS